MKIIAYGTPPLGGENNRVRQFDLELDGMSYYSFKKIYELGEGTDGPEAAPLASRGEGAHRTSTTAKPPEALMYSYVGMAIDDEEEEDDEAPLTMRSAPARSAPVDLFDSQPPTPTPIASPATASQFSFMHTRFAPPTQVQVPTSSMSQNMTPIAVSYSTPSLAVSSSSYSMSSYDEFAPVAVPQTQKSFDVISNQILGAYDNSSSYSSAPHDTSHQIVPQALVPVKEESMDAVTKSMKNLVNFDDITAMHSPSTINQQGNNWGFMGRAPTLSEINSAVRAPVMNTHHTPAMQQGFQQVQPQQTYHTGQPQAMMAHYGYNHNQPQQQYAPNMGYAPAY